MDNVHNGVNAVICEKLGLINCSILSPKKEILRKLITFCPVKNASNVRQALFAAGGGHIGNYDECSFNAEGFGTFRASESASPVVGKKGKQHQEKELRIEIIFPAFIEKRLIATLLEVHPYEEVAYDIVLLENSHQRIGSGMIGELKKEETEKSFLTRLKRTMKCEVVRHTKLTGKKIKRVAVCGGAGSFLIKDAIAAKADIFITTDMKYHEFFDADGKLVLADIGHFESEAFTRDLFYSVLTDKFPNFAVHLSKTNTNPINYI